MRKLFPLLLAACLFLGAALPASAANASDTAQKRFQAVWVSTVYHLDYPSQPTVSAEALRSQADEILNNCRDMGMNAIFLQVRPSADALYPSELFPWSAYLTGANGKAPAGGFDPLSYWVEGAHARGMELHAWVNPYRVTKGGDEEWLSLPQNHPAVQHPDWLVKHTDGNYYLNPGLPAVRQLVSDGVAEILDRYDVDGIHLDDYFYPGTDFPDQETFRRYGAGFSDVGDWRRDNVNRLVQTLQQTVREHSAHAAFGISPAGIWANRSSLPDGSDTAGGETYFSHYADSRKWVQEGWVDYICPQIYWNIGHDKADYAALTRWWADVVQGTGVKLYIGMADYRAGDGDTSSPWHGISEIRRQMELNRSLPGVDGEVHFRYGTMLGVPGLTSYYAETYAAD